TRHTNPNPPHSSLQNYVGPSMPNTQTSPPEGYVLRAQFDALQAQVQGLMALISSRPNLTQTHGPASSTEPVSQTPIHNTHPEQVVESTQNPTYLDELVDRKIKEVMLRPLIPITQNPTCPTISYPLSDHILEAPLPNNFCMPHIDA